MVVVSSAYLTGAPVVTTNLKLFIAFAVNFGEDSESVYVPGSSVKFPNLEKVPNDTKLLPDASPTNNSIL